MDEKIRQQERDSADREEEEEVVEVWTDREMRDEDVREMEGQLTREERQPVGMDKELVPLLKDGEAQEFRSRWMDIQTEFVDDPRNSVERADELVANVINSITENFASERTSLEEHWNRGEEASTEDLRLAMKRYRSFFNRLLTLETSGTAE